MLESDRKLQLLSTRVRMNVWDTSSSHNSLFHRLECFLRSWQYTLEVLTEALLKIQVFWVVTLRRPATSC